MRKKGSIVILFFLMIISFFIEISYYTVNEIKKNRYIEEENNIALEKQVKALEIREVYSIIKEQGLTTENIIKDGDGWKASLRCQGDSKKIMNVINYFIENNIEITNYNVIYSNGLYSYDFDARFKGKIIMK
jgi:hypothetical protein